MRSDLVEFVQLTETLVQNGQLLPTDTQFEFESVLDRQIAAMATLEEVAEDNPLQASRDRLALLGDSPLHAFDGPLWYRGNVHCSRLVEEDRLLAALDVIGADRLVIGHTPTPTRTVLERFDGRLIEVDTGMNAGYYKGSGHALVLEGDAIQVVNQRGESSEPTQHPRRVGVRPPGVTSRQALETLLAEGSVLLEEQDEAGRTVVTVGDSNRKANAFFVRRQGKDFYPDLAAYRLDRLLELDMVPIAVKREVGRKDGSLIYVAPKALNEQERVEAGRGGSAPCPLDDQWSGMYVFDALIYNEGRSPNRMLYSTDLWQLMLVGHERAFASRKGRPAWLKDTPLVVTPAWRRALSTLSTESVATEFDGILDRRRQKALLQRRDQLVESP